MSSNFWHDSEARKNFRNVFNQETLEALYKLADQGAFKVLHGFVKQGKEANVCVAEQSDGTKVAVKIYMIEAGNYRQMSKYLLNDQRFAGIKQNRRSIIFSWCKKEFKNLKKAEKAGVSAPRPISFRKNILVMDFIGEDFVQAPRLKEVELEQPEQAFNAIIDDVKKLWNEEEMVHGDLSEYNVLWYDKHYLIDFSQGILRHNPLADELLRRDVDNLCTHFNRRYGLGIDAEEILQEIRS
jgi:RIO kinase 1